MHRICSFFCLRLLFCVVFAPPLSGHLWGQEAIAPGTDEGGLISAIRQLTFDGLRAGEGYFSSDGSQLVFQSEREPGNPFYQIYLMDLETGDLQRVSPGWGKTTCAWIHPDGAHVLFASTQEDAAAREKQEEEYRLREEESRRYAWDYDKSFDLFLWNRGDGSYQQLTNTEGYDAEASISPDGKQIVFASNRGAYGRTLSDREQALLERDPASMVDLYLMDIDGGNVRRLTDSLGYDGGPFFSADGGRICWRRFSEDGATAEIYTMRTDGSDVRKLTSLGAMSWAPYFHPSGEYLIFTTNVHGFDNFELYLVRADGKGEPVRASSMSGFDGLPVFSPTGTEIAWTSNRTTAKRSQIFIGAWDHDEARRRLGFGDSIAADGEASVDRDAALAVSEVTEDGFSPSDVGRHVDYLTRRELAGRMTGSEGERRATAYVAAYLENLGYVGAGQDGSFFHEFEFPAGAVLTADNRLSSEEEVFLLDQDWRPLSFSGSGTFEPRPVVFAGYGLVVPESEDFEGYDSYVHLDVADKWVLIFRDLPQDIAPEQRQKMARYSSARRKVMMARDQGAYGVILVAGPTSKVSSQLIRFESDASAGGTSLPVISITNEIAQKWLRTADKELAALQRSLDDGSQAMGILLESVSLGTTIGIERRTGTGRNVLARLTAGSEPSNQVVIIGAHIDHLGMGQSSSSLARGDEEEMIHFGADDNASGVAAMLEIAQYLASAKRAGKLPMQRDLIVAAWSGEELGLFGSQAFADDFFKLYPAAKASIVAASGHAATAPDATEPDAEQQSSEAENPHADPQADPHAGLFASGHGASPTAAPLYPAVTAYLNLDMVGRLREKLVVQGIGSSPAWAGEIQRRNIPVGLALQLDKTSLRLPTDAAVFVGRKVPSLAAFTGAHEDYHTPRDTADKVNYEGAAKIARLFGLTARGLLSTSDLIPFELDEGEQEETPRVNLTAYLGTIPDYASGDDPGVKLSGVGKNGPAEKAGVKGGDVIVELAGKKIENIYDYTYAIEGLKIGQMIKMVVVRSGERLEFEVVPGSRE